MSKCLQDEIFEAIDEARILECAMEKFDKDHMLFVAQKLSGAPFSFVQEVYSKFFEKGVDIRNESFILNL